jgi:hypothetical protein
VGEVRLLKLRGDDPFICAVTVEEVTRGIRPNEDAAFVAFLQGLLVAPLGIPRGAWLATGSDLSRNGDERSVSPTR